MTNSYANDSHWSALANAIVIQAVYDYRRIRRKERAGIPLKRKEAKDKKRIQRFFIGSWFQELTDIDGFELLKKLDSETTYVQTRNYI